MNLIFDTETSGLFTSKRKFEYPSHELLENYDTCRIVSICWYVTQNDKIIEQSYYVIKPDNFKIGQESIDIHGITQEYAENNGVDIRFVLANFHEALKKCSNIVAHNIKFDIHTIKSELFRYGIHPTIELIDSKKHICTMAKGKEYMNSKKNPKLSELYKFIYKEDLVDAHNAIADTHHCYKCFIKMFPFDDNIFFFKDREIKLTEEQRAIVYSDIDYNILVLSSAGSGKSTTTLSRIKHLLNQGIKEEEIMLTTFTRDSTNDMRNKLFDILGYKSRINVGTIDSISKSYTLYKNPGELKDVGEYGSNFLELIRNDPSIASKYKYLCVDEFQDINEVQFNIIREFYKNGVKIFCVGDDAQNLYTFRGSNIEYILNFKNYFTENIHIFQLTYNFRSSRDIINFANASIDKNIHQIPKKMVPGLDIVSKKPVVKYFPTQSLQNQFLLTRILELIEKQVSCEEIAILSPVNQPLFHVEELFTQNNIPHVYLDGKSDVRSFIKKGHVCLCTIHKSKGLEWDHVFLINASDEIFPKMKNEKTMEDDRRVFYVAVTRPRKELNIYYSSHSQTPFVTRFVSELDRSLYNFEDFREIYVRGKSDVDFYSLEKSVTKLIDNLDGDDYIKLKEANIIPSFELIKQKLYVGYNYNPLIIKEDLYSDFGTFVDLFITRKMCDKKDKYALATLANITLTNADYDIYKQYRQNFKHNIKKIDPRLIDNIKINSEKIRKILEQNSKPITLFHMNVICFILTRICTNAKKFNLPLEKIPVFNYRFLPEDFETQMQDHLDNYSTDNFDLNDIWEVSKCKRIVVEYRRRLLFKNITGNDFLTDYKTLFDNISDKFVDFIKNKGTDIECHGDYEINQGIYGEIDLRIGDLLIDYKTSINDIKLENIIQLLCYKTLCDLNNKKINTIAIFNPLKGIYSELDVSTWNKHNELITYLLQKREYLIQKYT